MDEHLLGQVLRLVRVAQVLIGQPEDAALVSADEGLEGVPVAAACRPGETSGLDDRARLAGRGSKRGVLVHSPTNYTLNVVPVATAPVKAL